MITFTAIYHTILLKNALKKKKTSQPIQMVDTHRSLKTREKKFFSHQLEELPRPAPRSSTVPSWCLGS